MLTAVSATESSLNALRATRRLESGEPVKIVCLGDSITGIYYHTGGRRAWPEVLQHILRERYPQTPLKVINAGISGNTTTDALARLETDVLAPAPHLVVIKLGLNDVVRTSPEAFTANLRLIVQQIRQRGAEVVLLTFNAIYPEHPDRPLHRVLAYLQIVREVAGELSVPLADAHEAYRARQAQGGSKWFCLMSDAIHPNLRGHSLLAATAASIIAGQIIAPPDLPRPIPEFPRLRDRLRPGQSPLRVIAYTPSDTLIASVLERLFPSARFVVTPCSISGLTFDEVVSQAQADWPRYRDQSDTDQPDLFVVSFPADLSATDDEALYRNCSRLLNASQSFGQPQRWDCLVILPSVFRSQAPAAEEILRLATFDKDLPYLQRAPGDNAPAQELLLRELTPMLETLEG